MTSESTDRGRAGPANTQPTNGAKPGGAEIGRGVTLVGVVGTIDRGGGAEKAYWNISSGLRDQLGFDLVQVSQLEPGEPLADDRELHVLRRAGKPGTCS